MAEGFLKHLAGDRARAPGAPGLEAFGREIAVSDGGDGRPDPFTRA
jgi:hypothetical protein